MIKITFYSCNPKELDTRTREMDKRYGGGNIRPTNNIRCKVKCLREKLRYILR